MFKIIRKIMGARKPCKHFWTSQVIRNRYGLPNKIEQYCLRCGETREIFPFEMVGEAESSEKSFRGFGSDTETNPFVPNLILSENPKTV